MVLAVTIIIGKYFSRPIFYEYILIFQKILKSTSQHWDCIVLLPDDTLLQLLVAVNDPPAESSAGHHRFAGVQRSYEAGEWWRVNDPEGQHVGHEEVYDLPVHFTLPNTCAIGMAKSLADADLAARQMLVALVGGRGRRRWLPLPLFATTRAHLCLFDKLEIKDINQFCVGNTLKNIFW